MTTTQSAPQTTTMSCLTCVTEPGRHAVAAPVIGRCVHCGAAVCLDHAHIVAVPSRPVGLLPQPLGTQRIVCTSCA